MSSAPHDAEANLLLDQDELEDVQQPEQRGEWVRYPLLAVSVLAVVGYLTWNHPIASPQKAISTMESEEVMAAYKMPWECTANGDDCSSSKCCSEPGSQCYRKNKFWASCNATCATSGSGSKDAKPWTCEKVGERAPAACSWEGENCASTGCCRRQGFTCYEQQSGVGSCSPDCGSLKSASAKPWTCKNLGGAQPLRFAKPDPSNPAGSSLFCFMVITASGVVAPGVKPGYEEELVTNLKSRGLSVFACDSSRVYHGAKAQSGDWKSVVNTDIFIDVWKQVQADGLYKSHDWTVKADADAVFLPTRLKSHLEGMNAPANAPVYLHNIKFRFHFMGALEVLSRDAVDLFLQFADKCQQHLGSNGGEDYFTMQCLDSAGAAHMSDFSLLDDKYTHPPGWNLFDVNSCTNQAIVAFHPYKAVNSWLGCYKVTTGQQQPADFVGCDHRWQGDACNLDGPLEHGPADPQPSDGIVVRK